MTRNLLIHTLLAVALLAITGFATADTLTLKNGHIHHGKITAEEEGRIQIKLENSGVRLWFPRNQVLEFAVDEPAADEEEQETRPEAYNSPAGLEDDVERARQMLEELRQQQLNTLPKKKKRKSRATITKPPPKGKKKKGAPLVLTNEGVDGLIQILRTHHDFYKRLDAVKNLGRAGATQAIPDLIHALDDDVGLLRSEANKSLIKITGQNFGFKATDKRNVRLWAIEKWEDWYAAIKREKAKDDLGSWF